MESRTILQEEIDIKEEEYIDLTIDTNESNISSGCSLQESNPSFKISYLKPITQELPSKEIIDLTSDDNNVCIGIDDSLQVNPVKGTFSLETIGSKTLVVFRRLPGDRKTETANKEVSGCPCPNCDSVFSSHVLLSTHMNEVHSLDEVKKKILEGRYIKICLKCKTPSTSNLVVHCASCSAKLYYKCQQCNQTFINYEKLSHHLLMQCSPEGYYHCPHCGYRSINFNFVHRHVLRKHPNLGTNFDLHDIVWKDAIVDAHSILSCPKCDKEFSSVRSLNEHIVSRCQKIKALKSMNLEFRIDKNAQVNGRYVVPHCNQCNEDTEFYQYINLQPCCTICKSVLVFKCTICDKLINHNVYVDHVKSICKPQRKLYSCRFCTTNFHSSLSLSEHEEQHGRNFDQPVELPLERRSSYPTGDFEQSNVSCDKSINRFGMRKGILSSSNQEKKSSILFASQKYNEIFAEECELTREPKHCDNKLRMQCKVVLTPLNIQGE